MPIQMKAVKYYFVNSIRILLLLLCACKHKPRLVAPAFYYWKSDYQPRAFELTTQKTLRATTLYLHFFDVDWDDLTRQPAPKAVMRFTQRPVADSIIPTVFITNQCLQQCDSSNIPVLAKKMALLVKDMLYKDSLPAPAELQLDCDWSATTREKYFSLLRHIRTYFPNVPLSATIRLYQTKYKDKAGIPPVDRGLLMCYNMGNLKNAATGNSIIEPAELRRYIGNLNTYPLPLDVALPIFNWTVWFSRNEYKGLVSNLPDSVLHSPVFAATGNRYVAQMDTTLGGYRFFKNDLLRYEGSAIQDLYAVADELRSKLKNTRCRVSLYHLDSVLLTKYSINELEGLFDRFR